MMEALRPITWQDVRLAAGEGPLSAETILAACNAELARRAAHTPLDSATVRQCADYLRSYAGGHHMAQSCADALLGLIGEKPVARVPVDEGNKPGEVLPWHLMWKGPGPEPRRWTASDGTIVYRSYGDYVDD